MRKLFLFVFFLCRFCYAEIVQNEDSTSTLAISLTSSKTQVDSLNIPLKSSKVLTAPWYTGTLLSYGSSNNLPGQLSFQPYVYATNSYGSYDSKGRYSNISDTSLLVLSAQLALGILSWLDLSLYGQFTQTLSDPGSKLSLGPTQVYLGFQALQQDFYTYKPDIRFLAMGIFPTGSSEQSFTSRGQVFENAKGPYEIGPGVVIAKTFFPQVEHPINVNFNLLYLYSFDLNVEGTNIYGGDETTLGTIHPGGNWFINTALQYTMLPNWALASDFSCTYTKKSKFIGSSITPLNTDEVLIFEMTPSVEYNRSENIGFLFTLWFSLFGKNTEAFIGGSISTILSF